MPPVTRNLVASYASSKLYPLAVELPSYSTKIILIWKISSLTMNLKAPILHLNSTSKIAIL